MNPGSQDAIANGCTCPILDNAHGSGYLGDGEQYGWWMDANCPLHNTAKSPENGVFEKEEA